jgi:hypothetical protein
MISCHGPGRAHRTALSVSRRDLLYGPEARSEAYSEAGWGCRVSAVPISTRGRPSLYSGGWRGYGADSECYRRLHLIAREIEDDGVLPAQRKMERIPIDRDLAVADPEEAPEVVNRSSTCPVRSTLLRTCRPNTGSMSCCLSTAVVTSAGAAQPLISSCDVSVGLGRLQRSGGRCGRAQCDSRDDGRCKGDKRAHEPTLTPMHSYEADFAKPRHVTAPLAQGNGQQRGRQKTQPLKLNRPQAY